MPGAVWPAPACTVEPHLTREEWLEARRGRIGGSVIAAILGIDHYRTAISVYAENAGLVEDEEAGEAASIGTLIEPWLAEQFTARIGLRTSGGGLLVMRSRERPFMGVTIDRQIEPVEVGRPDRAREDFRGFAGMGPGILSIKSRGIDSTGEWEDGEVPAPALAQIQTEFYCTGYRWGAVAVLIGGYGGMKIQIVPVERNEAQIEKIVTAVDKFWRDLQDGKAPPPGPSESAKRTLAAMYPVDIGEVVTLPEEALDHDHVRQEAAEEIKKWEVIREGASNALKAMIGEASVGILPGGGSYSFKLVKRAGYTVQPTQYRELRRKK